ncbi:MAG: hypothetical protein ACE5J4_01320 [Candidatus Aenigmatarchaeota archaeon]
MGNVDVMNDKNNKVMIKINKELIIYTLIGIAISLALINQVLLLNYNQDITGSAIVGGGYSQSNSVIPNGIPSIYGQELGISFDDVSPNSPTKADETIRKLAFYDRDITLSGEDLERYISIASQISCEYCCGAPSIISSDGSAACGCAHSYAMRGLAKYLIKNHPEMSDDQILEELGKWKTLFFPTQMTAKAKVLTEKGIRLNYINLASNNYRGIEAGTDGGMVGGC